MKKKLDKILITKSSMPAYEEYIEAIKPLWDSHWLTNMGQYHRQLEKELCQYLGVKNLSLMVNGHMALEMAIQAFNFKKGAEVITTPFTFISTTHAIVRNGLVPVFCDVKEDGTIDPSKIEDLVTDKTVAIAPVHVYGNICDVEEIDRIAKIYELKVIYDAAHAFGIKYHGKGIGTYGDASVFSFHATKVFNSIEGGAVTFSNEWMYESLYNLKNFGIRGEEKVVSIGANAKMNEFSAIMGLLNLKHIDDTIKKRCMIVNQYQKAISKVKGIKSIKKKNEFDNNGYFPIVVTDEYKETRDELYDRFRKNEIYVRKYFYPLTIDQDCYKDIYHNDVTQARELSKRVLTLPVFEDMTDGEFERVVEILKY